MEARRPGLPSGQGATSCKALQGGGFYFVLDGHHRLSVASYHGVEWIDAEVTEFGARLSKARGRADEQPKRGEPNMYQWLPPQLLKDIHEQAVRDAQQGA